jgi:hypothetical protein
LHNTIHRGPLPHSVAWSKTCSKGSINAPASPFRAEKSRSSSVELDLLSLRPRASLSLIIPMNIPTTISAYLRAYGNELGEKVLTQFPPLHSPGDPIWPALKQLKRKPFPAQTLAILGIVKRWEEARAAAAVAECGTGKTLVSLGSVFTHARGRSFTALAMCPPSLVEKWGREALLTLPGVRVFVIDGVRNGVASNGFTGVNEVRLRSGRIVHEGIKTTLSDMRLAKTHRSARARWNTVVNAPSVILTSRGTRQIGILLAARLLDSQKWPISGQCRQSQYRPSCHSWR